MSFIGLEERTALSSKGFGQEVPSRPVISLSACGKGENYRKPRLLEKTKSGAK